MATVTGTVEQNEMNLGSPGEPINSFVFLNPANINGARLYGTLTRTVFNSRGTVLHLSVDRCVRGRAISGLVNSPPKCMNFRRNNRLARGMEEGPCSIMLFSRVRGTRPSMFGVLLRVLRSNELASSRNEAISFGGAVVVVASGINTELVARGRDSLNFGSRGRGIRRDRGGSVGRLMANRLHGMFHPRFLGHISSVVIFGGLGGSRVGRVTIGVLGALRGHLSGVGVGVDFASGTVDRVTSGNFSRGCNTEPLHHTVRGRVRSPLSRRVLRNGIGSNTMIAYSFTSNRFAFAATGTGWTWFLVGVGSATRLGALQLVFLF